MSQSRSLYRSRNGILLGVCRGVATYFNISVFWTRACVVLAALFTGFWAVVLIYVVAAFLMKKEPILPLHDEGEREFYESYASSRTMALKRLKRKFDNMDRRVRRMEDRVTSREYDWDRRMRSSR